MIWIPTPFIFAYSENDAYCRPPSSASIGLGRRVRGQPVPIRLVFRIGDVTLRLFGVIIPVMRFGMSVRKGKPAAHVMISSGKVQPLAANHRHGESRVVEA